MTLDVTSNPLPVTLLSVNVSAISAVLFASNAPVNVVAPVTANVPPILVLLAIPTPPATVKAPEMVSVD